MTRYWQKNVYQFIAELDYSPMYGEGEMYELKRTVCINDEYVRAVRYVPCKIYLNTDQ